MLKILQTEFVKHKLIYFLLAIVLFFSFFVRVYRIDQLLGFYLDQGRDAKVIWDLWHIHKFFLIGPTTGIEGIYRGPWYYWLIAPFYLIGKGDPVWPSVFLSFTTVLASFVAFLIGKRQSYITGLIAAVIAGSSFYLVLAARWLSNPTPMFLISMLFVYSFFCILEGRKIYWVALGLISGLAMQFGSAAELFYFPAILIFAIWQRKKLPSSKLLIMSIILLFLTFVPQIVFDFIHNHVLLSAIHKFLLEDKSFKVSFWEMLSIRIPFYYDVFFSKLFVVNHEWRDLSVSFLGLCLLYFARNLFSNKYFKVISLVFISPLVGMLFFQGNHGNVYDYYFTGYYLVFVLFVAYILGYVARKSPGNILVFLFVLLILVDNLPLLKNYMNSGTDGPNNIVLDNELQAVQWAIHDSNNRKFNQDVYVPPVIPHAYDYLFLWQTNKICGENMCNMQLGTQVPLLYTLYEVDPPHPERLEAWLSRQKGIGIVEEAKKFGGVTVQRRHRI